MTLPEAPKRDWPRHLVGIFIQKCPSLGVLVRSNSVWDVWEREDSREDREKGDRIPRRPL